MSKELKQSKGIQKPRQARGKARPGQERRRKWNGRNPRVISCLRCGVVFRSTGPQHRHCDDCRLILARLADAFDPDAP